MITRYLIYDISTLFACSLTYSCWYIPVVPHLRRTLAILIAPSWRSKKLVWSKLLSHIHKLGLFERIRVCKNHSPDYRGCTPKCFDCRPLYHFFALVNVKELEMIHINIRRFMLRVRWYFKDFLPTL